LYKVLNLVGDLSQEKQGGKKMLRKIRNRKFCLIMAVIFAFSVVFPIAAMANISRSGSLAVVAGSSSETDYKPLSTVVVTVGNLQLGSSVIVALPRDFRFDVSGTANLNGLDWIGRGGTVAGDVYRIGGNKTFIEIPENKDNGLSVTGGASPGGTLKVEYLDAKTDGTPKNFNEIKITIVGGPNTNEEGTFRIVLGSVYVDSGYQGEVPLTFTVAPNSYFDAGEVMVGRVEGGSVRVEVTDSYTFDDKGVVTFRLIENREKGFEKSTESVRLTLPKGFAWDEKYPIELKWIYGSYKDKNYSNVYDNDDCIFTAKPDGSDLLFGVKAQTAEATCIQITARMVVDDPRKAEVGDVIARVRGKSTISQSEVTLGVYGEIGLKATAADPTTVYGGQLEQKIANFSVEELMNNTFVMKRTLTLTLPEWAKWGKLPDKVSNRTVDLYLERFLGTDGRTAQYRVVSASGTKLAKLDFKKMEICLSPLAPAGDVTVEIAGTQGSYMEVVVAKVEPPMAISVSDTPALVIGRSGQAIGEITLTEAVDDLIKDGRRARVGNSKRYIILELPEGVYWDLTPDVKVTSGGLEIKSVKVGEDTVMGTDVSMYYNTGSSIVNTDRGRDRRYLSLEVSDSSVKPATIVIDGTITVDREVPEGFVEVKVKGNSPMEVNSYLDVDKYYDYVSTVAGGDASRTIGGGYYWWMSGCENTADDTQDPIFVRDVKIKAIERDVRGMFYNDTYVVKANIAKVDTPAPATETTRTTSITLGDNGSYISDGRIMVQLRHAAEALGIGPKDILWDGPSKTVTLLKGDRIAQLRVGVPQVKLNGVDLPTDKGAEIRDGRTYISLSAAGIAFNAVTTWDNTAKVATITINPQAVAVAEEK